MSIKKQYLKSKNVCKVTFKIPKETAKDFKNASVVGDFNHWNHKKHKMKKLKTDGSFSLLVEFEKGHEYQFRYLLDGKDWANDTDADKHVTTYFGDSENSVLVI